MTSQSREKKPGKFLIAVFLGIVFSTLLVSLFNFGVLRSDTEKRSLSAMPKPALDRTALRTFPGQFEKFFADRFGFRNELVYLHNLLRVSLLKTSPLEKVVLGGDGWLYYADERAMSPDPLTLPLLDLWRTALEAKHAWLRARGITYVFMVVPDKHTVYPEHLPMGNYRSGGTSNLDRLLDYLGKDSPVKVLDVRQRLTDAKSAAPVYYKTDTHWNRFGAAVACNELLRRIGENFLSVSPLWSGQLQPQTVSISGKDMAAMLLLPNLLTDQEVDPQISVGDAHFIFDAKATPDGLLLSRSVNRHGELPRAVVFHDSFFNAMKPYFAEKFSVVEMAGGNLIHKFPVAMIERNQPAIVVEEIVERYLTGAPQLPQQIRDWYRNERAGGRNISGR